MSFKTVILILFIGIATQSVWGGRGSLFALPSHANESPVLMSSSVDGAHALASSSSPFDGRYVSSSSGHNSLDSPLEWVWQRPVVKGRGQVLRGLVFLAHGCNHNAIDFFPRSDSCRKCIGLPEEVRMSSGLLRQQYAVVAVTSSGSCWSDSDFPRVKKVIEVVVAELGAQSSLPLYAIGASSGGSFVAHLPNFMNGFKAVVIQIMAVAPRSLIPDQEDATHNSYPPTLWIGMEKDDRTKRNMLRAVKYLTQHDRTSEFLEAKSFPLTETYFSERIRGMSSQVSHDIVSALLGCKLLDENSYLLDDPRQSDWVSCLRQHEQLMRSLSGDTLESDVSPISEEMNVAFAMHELTANQISDMINFLMKYK